ncbi:putative ankyrin-repeat protein [Balamuthia mandrillaris]
MLSLKAQGPKGPVQLDYSNDADDLEKKLSTAEAAVNLVLPLCYHFFEDLKAFREELQSVVDLLKNGRLAYLPKISETTLHRIDTNALGHLFGTMIFCYEGLKKYEKKGKSSIGKKLKKEIAALTLQKEIEAFVKLLRESQTDPFHLVREGELKQLKAFILKAENKGISTGSSGVSQIMSQVQGRSKQTLLHVACDLSRSSNAKAKAKQLDIVKYLLSKSDANDVNAMDANNWTPLHVACETGNVHCISLLLENRFCDASLLTVDGSSPIHYFVRKTGQNAEFKNLDDSVYISLLDRLVDKGGNALAVNMNGETALHKAASKGASMVVIEWLLKSGININALTKYDETALHMAVRASDANMVQILLELGADKSVGGKSGQTALSVASEQTKISRGRADSQLVLSLLSGEKAISDSVREAAHERKKMEEQGRRSTVSGNSSAKGKASLSASKKKKKKRSPSPRTKQAGDEKIKKLLEGLGLEKYYDMFIEEEFLWEDLEVSTDEDLKALGLKKGPRMRILRALQGSEDFDQQLDTIVSSSDEH